MNELELFQELKKRILETYQKSYPYFQGDWDSFSSKDIRQLIELVEIQLKERVSEKWIYTHLKPEGNEKLPRKDMLDIFSRFVGYSEWEEFVFKNQNHSKKSIVSPVKKESKLKPWIGLLFLVPMIGFGIYILQKEKKPKSIEIKNEFTNEPLKPEEIAVYKVKDDEKIPVEVVDSKIEIDASDEKIIIESPYFEKKEVELDEKKNEIFVKPEDYALVLKTFIDADLREWEDRRAKLEKILSDDLEVIILLKENLGAQYLNKDEFSGKLIVPTSETKKMKILNLETNNEKQITFIRIQQL
ncbi:hypothetical protein [Moheibacter lacus]|uniref:Uncharacterized protein n=1 Tax=Moheibacter lacus TaxID=2745851 RepID=A0A838ZQ07_9FLAO|nr:hypothetical protein [Moheibacter lacus]MBA5629717.1 hypothetical protein [Moheibacter lacus]